MSSVEGGGGSVECRWLEQAGWHPRPCVVCSMVLVLCARRSCLSTQEFVLSMDGFSMGDGLCVVCMLQVGDGLFVVCASYR